jgi:lysyl endopeptidase
MKENIKYSVFLKGMPGKLFLSVCLFSLAALSLSAQRSFPGLPPGFSLAFPVQSSLIVPMPSLEEIYRQDEANPGSNRFAAPVEVDISPDNAGEWQSLPDGRKVWRLKVKVPGALGLFAQYDAYYLPDGAKLFMYPPDQSIVKGAYTEKNNREHGKFITGMIPGEEAIIEYVLPANKEYAKGQFHIHKLLSAYSPAPPSSQGDFQVYQGQGFGDALPCHININCPEGDPWQDEKRGIVRIVRVFEEGVGWCTGSLINNTAQDGRPLLLTAYHCIDVPSFTPDFDLWRFDFHYEFSGCATESEEPPFQSILGCQPLSGRAESDFALLEITYGIPYSFQARFNGWDRTTSTPPNGTIVHHPQGDVKKYAKDTDPLSVYPLDINWNNGVTTPAYHHFRVELDEGTIEGGSSGAPLLNSNGLIVGQLHGGNANCTNFLTFHGRLNKSWDEGDTPETRLKEWLDPLETGALTIPAMDAPDTLDLFGGYVRDKQGNGIANVQVVRGGVDTVVTASDGAFVFQNIPLDSTGWISFYKNTGVTNGVTTFDAVLIQKHILQVDPFQDPLQLMAADIDQSGYISTFDLLELIQVILNIKNDFSATPSWQFLPERFDVRDVPMQATGVEIRAVKMGDVNFTADPKE